MIVRRNSSRMTYILMNMEFLAKQYVKQGKARSLEEARAILYAKMYEPAYAPEVDIINKNQNQPLNNLGKLSEDTFSFSGTTKSLSDYKTFTDLFAQEDGAINNHAHASAASYFLGKSQGNNIDFLG